MTDRFRRMRSLALAAAGVLTIVACQEDLSGGAACPALCPEQGLEVRDTTLFPVTLDTTLVGYPAFGTAPLILLAARGDTLRTAAVARFDTLLRHLTRTADTTAGRIVSLDTAFLTFVVTDTPLVRDSVTFELYDVDTTGVADPDTVAIKQLFRGGRLLSSVTVARDTVIATQTLPVPTSFLTPRLTSGQRVRFGIAVRSDSSVAVHMLSAQAQNAPVLHYLARAAADTQTLAIVASSKAPAGGVSDLADYGVTLAGPVVPLTRLVVGGLPGSRSYLQFALPETLLTQNTIVRATLELVQAPNRTFPRRDSVFVAPRIVRATTVLEQEPGKAAFLLGSQVSFPMPVLALEPPDSGRVSFQVARAVATWRSDLATTLKSLVLQAADEGYSASAIYFYSADPAVPDSLRPRLKLSLIPRAQFGLP